MGSGCSSPLKRFGGKRSKPSRRESSPYDIYGEQANEAEDGATGQRPDDQPTQSQPKPATRYQEFVGDNEVTIQSEVNEDHPSTTSCYTNGKAINEDTTRISDQSASLGAHVGQPSPAMAATTTTTTTVPSSGAGAVARMVMGLNGSYAPHDRHLLVSPALSPAPSSCYSPSPASSNPGSATLVDLNELNEAFTILTFGSNSNKINSTHNEPKMGADSTDKQQQHHHHQHQQQQASEMANNTHYTQQQLIQTQEDLINFISVIFVAADNFQYKTTTTSDSTNDIDSSTQSIEHLANSVESDLKTYCDEHLFKLRFLNLSQTHLSEYFHINNIVDVSTSILEKEFRDNSQRIVVIFLANSSNVNQNNNINPIDVTTTTTTTSDSSTGRQNYGLDKRQLPTKLEAPLFNKIKGASKLEERTKELLKRWYNQVGNTFYLNPIYTVYSKILSNSKEERDDAWSRWLSESSQLVQAIDALLQEDPELALGIKLKSTFSSCIEYINKESSLQKRTLLIRSLSQSALPTGAAAAMAATNQPQQAGNSIASSKDGSVNELARLLADPNKLTLKRSASSDDQEHQKTITDWIGESFGKFIESFLESRIALGKHVPPFIERNLFMELTVQRNCLEYYIKNITENSATKSQNFFTNQISPILDDLMVADQPPNQQQQQQEPRPDRKQSSSSSSQQPSANHLVFISGPRGCGKSTLFAQIIKLTAHDLINKAQIIYRFCPISLDSLSANRLLRSICEQFCQTQGENITAASYIYSSRSEIMNALNKITKSQTSLLFIDGLDRLKISSEFDLDWLCELEASSKLKIFITLETDSDLYKRVLSSYGDATHISLDSPSTGEWAQMLTATVKSRRFTSLGNLYDEIKTKSNDSDKKSFKQASDIINLCRIRKLNNEAIYPELTARSLQMHLGDEFKKVRPVILQHLGYLLTPYQLCALLVILNSSRNGLSDTDIINIMTTISQNAKIIPSEFRFSSTLLNYLKIQLKPWLQTILYTNATKTSIQADFLSESIEHYVSGEFPTIVADVREVLVEYFNRQTRGKSSKVSLIRSSDSTAACVPKERVTTSERSWLASQASEIVNLMLETSPPKARDYILNKNQFFQLFLYGSMPEEFIEDFSRLKDLLASKKQSKDSGTEDLQQLANYIKQSVYPLRYDGSQIYSQIYCKAYEAIKSGKGPKSKRLNEFLNTSACPPIYNLLPVSEPSINSFIRTRIGPAQRRSSIGASASAPPPSSGTLAAPSASTNQKPATKLSTNSNYYHLPASQTAVQTRQRIFTIRDNHRHVIVIYPDKDMLSVWDIYEEKAVRTINNLDQPRDLRMIDQKRAVILCNRELRVYDLDSGNLLTKLKGVMNQKMPFFEVFGENYVVALARNRMYVNMLNLSTGELETTFKVGEDRFLNSLLVSANGGICVCGDETQKPFPLLVWNLNERRLLYDLRLERHEFLTRMSAISDDGHFVVSICRQLGDHDSHCSSSSSANHHPSQTGSTSSNNCSSSGARKSSPNFIVVYDLSSGTLFKKWKPGLDSCSVAISLSASRSGKVINTIVDSSILVWDLATGSKRHTLVGHSAPADVINVQNNRLFSMDSTCRDQSLRIWDIEEGYCLAVFSPDAPVNCCQISIRGDALVCGFAAETRLSTLVLCKNETANDVVKRNKRRKSSRSVYIFDEPPSRKSSS